MIKKFVGSRKYGDKAWAICLESQSPQRMGTMKKLSATVWRNGSCTSRQCSDASAARSCLKSPDVKSSLPMMLLIGIVPSGVS